MSLTKELLLDPTYLSNEVAGADERPHYYESATLEIPIYMAKVAVVASRDDIISSTLFVDVTKQGRIVTFKMRRWKTTETPSTEVAGAGVWTNVDPLVNVSPSEAIPTVHIPRRFLPFVDPTGAYAPIVADRTYRWEQDALLLGLTTYTVPCYQYDGENKVLPRVGKLKIYTGNAVVKADDPLTPNFAPGSYGTFELSNTTVESEIVTDPPTLTLPGKIVTTPFFSQGSGIESDVTLVWQAESAANNIPEGWATVDRENYFDASFPCPGPFPPP